MVSDAQKAAADLLLKIGNDLFPRGYIKDVYAWGPDWNFAFLMPPLKMKQAGVAPTGDPLASIPFDNAIFQSFGQHRFVVDTLPNSLFSRHVAGIAFGLFSDIHPELLCDKVREMASTLNESWFVSSRKAIVEAFGSMMKARLLR